MQVTAANTINTASALAIAAVNPAGGSPIMASVSKNTVKVSFGTDKDAFDFFLQRKFLP
jgi:hypothetical protein